MTETRRFITRQIESFKGFTQSAVFPIFMIVFVDVLGAGIVIPVIPLYAENQLKGSAQEVAWLTSVYFGMQFLAAPVLGRLSDRIGRRPVLLLSQAGTTIALIMSGLAPNLPFLFLARAIDGITGGNISVAEAYLNDVTDENNRTQGLGIINASFSVGFLIGPAFGSIIAAWFGPRVPFYCAALISLGTIVLTFFRLPEIARPADQPSLPDISPEDALYLPHRSGAHKLLYVLGQPGVALIMLIGFGSQFAFFCWNSIWVLWVDDLLFPGRGQAFVQQVVGGFYTLNSFFGIITQIWLIGPAVRRFRESGLIIFGILVRSLSWGWMFFFPALVPAMISVPLIVVGGGLSNPALTATITYITPSQHRGLAIGAYNSAQNMGRIIGPIAAGYLFVTVSPGSPMGLSALFSSLTFLATLATLTPLFNKRESQTLPEATP